MTFKKSKSVGFALENKMKANSLMLKCTVQVSRLEKCY